jgi:hypothetical protein
LHIHCIVTSSLLLTVDGQDDPANSAVNNFSYLRSLTKVFNTLFANLP